MEMEWVFEERGRILGYNTICGVDEAGRGPLAGDVYAAAVILPYGCEIPGVNDSKKLTEKRRDELYEVIKETAISYCVATASAKEIDEINILNAAMLAMRRAIDGLSVKPDYALIDGNKAIGFTIPTRTIVKGDSLSISIASASILAKVERDRYMLTLHEKYPQYQFDKHKGYPTKLHYEMIDKYGICDEHRRSFLKKRYGTTSDMGAKGEDIAVKYLESEGYRIIGRNYKSDYGEIDIIAELNGTVAMVEVKLRKDDSYMPARAAVSAKKKENLRSTADVWLSKEKDKHKIESIRMDIIEVYTGAAKDSPFGVTYAEPKINHIKNAF